MKKKRKSYSKDFKVEAVRMLDSGVTHTQVARQLGINVSMIYRWRDQLHRQQDKAFPGKGNPSPENEELISLRREVEVLRQERDFLKKTALYFAKESK